MLVTTSAHTTTSMGVLGSQAMQVPTTRVTVDVGPVGEAGASRLLVPFRFTAVDALSTPGVEDYHKRPNSTQRVRWMVQYDINNVTRLLHKSYTPRQRNSYLRRPFRQGNDTDRRIASR